MMASLQDRFGRIFSDPSHLALTLLIGALVGSMIVAFLACTDWMHALLFAKAMPVWMRPLTPAVAALIAGYLLLRMFPDARGSGIPQTKAALIASGGDTPPPTTPRHARPVSPWLRRAHAVGRRAPAVAAGAG